MRVITTQPQVYDPDNKPQLWFLGDMHIGAPDFVEEALDRDIAAIKANPEARWIGMGDYGDLITHMDKRYEPGTLDARYLEAGEQGHGVVTEQREHITEKLETIASQCIGLYEGNHEAAIWRHQNRHFLAELAMALNCETRVVGYHGIVMWRFKNKSKNSQGSQSVVIHAGHGWQSGRRDGANINQLELEQAFYPDAHIVARGHAHKRFCHPFDVVRRSGKDFYDSTNWGVFTGTYKIGADREYKGDIPERTWRYQMAAKPPRPAKWEARKMFRPKNIERMGAPVLEVTIRWNGTKDGYFPVALEPVRA